MSYQHSSSADISVLATNCAGGARTDAHSSSDGLWADQVLQVSKFQ